MVFGISSVSLGHRAGGDRQTLALAIGNVIGISQTEQRFAPGDHFDDHGNYRPPESAYLPPNHGTQDVHTASPQNWRRR